MASSARRLYGLAFVLLAAAAGLGALAWAHMQSLAAYGPICGGALAHCAACPAALAALAAGLMTLALAGGVERRAAAPARVRARAR